MDTRLEREKTKSYLVLLILYISLKPVYLFNSGGLQICDFVFILAVILEVISSRGIIRFGRGNESFDKMMILLVLYQIIINSIWYIIVPDSRLLLSSAFYLYNLIAFFYIVAISRKYGVDTLKKSIVIGLLVSEIITIFGIIIYKGTSARNVGFFNNPNQLGLYGLLVITFLFFIRDYPQKIIRYIMVIMAVVAIVFSVSKAAILALTGFGLLYILFADRQSTMSSRIKKLLLLLVMGALVYIFLFSTSLNSYPLIRFIRLRILNMANENDSGLLTGRGYGRISEMGANILWGMGEGAYFRFNIMNNNEVHSFIASIFVSYGIIGFLGYLLMHLYLIVDKGKTLYNLAGLSGIILYGITHNSIRNTLLWFIFAILYINKSRIGFGNGEADLLT